MHREGGRDIIIGFALFNKSPSSRGLFSSKIISFCAIQCFSGTRLSPLNFSLLRFLRRLICRTPKVPFSFPLLLFVRVSFNPRSRSSFSFPYLCLSFTAHPLHQLPLPLSLSVMFPQLFQPPRQFPFRPPRSFSPPSLPPIQRRFASSITFLPRLATLCSPSTSHPPVLLSLGTCRDSRYEFRSQTFDNLIIHCEKNKRVFVPFQRVVETISRKGIALNRGQERSSKTRRMNE